MATKSKSKSKSHRSDRSERNDRDNRSNREEKSEFISITKLFETKKNPDNLVGTCKPEYLDKLEDLLAEAREQDKGISFFVFLTGKWGPNLSATLARDEEQGGSRSRYRSGSNRNWR